MLPVFYIYFQSDDAYNPDRLYDLVAVVIHCGSGPNRGHYISIVKSHGLWLLFDDDIVDVSNYASNFILVLNIVFVVAFNMCILISITYFNSRVFHFFSC